MAKLIDRKSIMSGIQGAAWVGVGIYTTTKATGYLNSNIATIGDFSRAGKYQAAGVTAGTGLLTTGLIAMAIGRKNGSAGRKAGAYMAAGALISALGPIVTEMWGTMGSGMRAGGHRRRGLSSAVTQALPSASAAPSGSMLRAGGTGIVMGAPAIDAGPAAAALGRRAGGRYINPRFEWSNVRELY